MSYDPDGDPNIDPTDLEAIDAFLNDPTVHALHAELGRQFAARPPEEQIEELATNMMRAQESRDSVAAVLADAPVDDPRRALLQALQEQVAAYRRRIAEVRDQR